MLYNNSEIRPLDKDKFYDKMSVAWIGPEIGELVDKLKKPLDLNFDDNILGLHFNTNNLFPKYGAIVESVLNRKK